MSSAGQEAAELAESAGLFLDPWQRFVLDVSLRERADGRWAAFEVGVVVARQNGKGSIIEARELAGLFLMGEDLLLHSAHEFKALDVATPVLTPSGWTTMGALEDGDEVFAPDGQVTKVVCAHPVRHGRPCHEVRFDDGQCFVADEDHLWRVFDTELQRSVTVSTGDMVGSVSTVTPRSGRDRRTYRFRVALAGPLQQPEADLPVDPWLLGAWLGDGTSGKGELTVGETDLSYVLGRLDGLGETWRLRPDRRHPSVVSVIITDLAQRLKSIGVLGNKQIPVQYLTASERQRRALLAGLMDTDGGVQSHQVTITMIRKNLMRDVATLVRSLGYKATLREFRASIDGRDAGPMWRVQFAASQGVSPFGLPRKSLRVRPVQQRSTRSQYNAIVSVVPVESRPTRCITVAHESSCYLVGDSVTTHNTAEEAFRRIRFLIEDCPDLDRHVRRVTTSHGQEGIELMSGARLKFVARTSGSGRGFTGDCVIFDEAFNLGPDQIGALMPTLSARPNPQIWYMSSAAMSTSEQLHTLRRRALAGDGGGRLAYLEWSAANETDGDAVEVANPALGIRIHPEFVAMERESMPADIFRRERLGIPDDPPASVDEVVPFEAWAGCERPSPLGPGTSAPVWMAVDVPPDRSSAAVAAATVDGDGVVHVVVVDEQRGTGWVADRCAELAAGYNVCGWLVDPGGPAGALLPQLADRGIVPAVVTARQMAAACGAFYDLIAGGRLGHNGDRLLAAAVRHGRRRPLGDAWAWARKDTSVSIAPLVAVTLASWAAAQPPEPAAAGPLVLMIGE